MRINPYLKNSRQNEEDERRRDHLFSFNFNFDFFRIEKRKKRDENQIYPPRLYDCTSINWYMEWKKWKEIGKTTNLHTRIGEVEAGVRSCGEFVEEKERVRYAQVYVADVNASGQDPSVIMFLFRHARFSHRPNMSRCECWPRGYWEPIEIRTWTSLDIYLWCCRTVFRHGKNWRLTQVGKVEWSSSGRQKT